MTTHTQNEEGFATAWQFVHFETLLSHLVLTQTYTLQKVSIL